MAEEAKAGLGTMVAELEAMLPADLETRDIDTLTAPEALGLASLLGSRQLVRIVSQPLAMDNLKQQRLIGDMAHGSIKLMKAHAEGQRNHDLIGRLLQAIEAERAPEAVTIENNAATDK